MDVKFGCDCLTSSEVRVLYVQEADLQHNVWDEDGATPWCKQSPKHSDTPISRSSKSFCKGTCSIRALRPELTVLRRAVEQHPALQWDDRLRTLAGQEADFAGCCAKRCEVEAVTLQAFEHVLCFLFAAQGTVTKDDPSDGTSSVRFPPPIGRTPNDLWHSKE